MGPYDQGGYFIIDGKEKVIISQERIAPNKLFLSVPTAENVEYSLKGECNVYLMKINYLPKVLYLYMMKIERKYNNYVEKR